MYKMNRTYVGFAVASGHFDALLLDEVETEDDRFFELRSLVAGANTVIVAAAETSAVGNGTSRDLRSLSR